MLDRIARLHRRSGSGHAGGSARLVLTDQGFDVLSAEGLAATNVAWDTVQSIRAWKLDLVIYDCVCLAFQTAVDAWVEISEEDEGFAAVEERMREKFPGVPATWLLDITVPAFEPTHTMLYPHYDKPRPQQGHLDAQDSGRGWFDAIRLRDFAGAACGTLAAALLHGTGHPVLMASAAATAGLTLLAAVAVRRHYEVRDPPADLRRTFRGDGLLRQRIVDRLGERAWHRVVPRQVRAACFLLRSSNVALLIAAWIIVEQAAEGR